MIKKGITMKRNKKLLGTQVYYAKLAFCPLRELYRHCELGATDCIEKEEIVCKTETRLNVAVQAVVKKKMKEHKVLVKMKTGRHYDFQGVLK